MAEQAASLRPTVVVVGAGSGIGSAAAEVLASKGWRLACLDVDLAGARTTADRLGDGHIAIQVDIASEESVIAAFREVEERFQRIDGLAACAGISESTPFEQLDAAKFARVFAVNATGTFLVMREAAKLMRDGGRMIAVSSVAGLRGGGVFGTAAYAASKGAVLALCKTAARALAPRKIRVNCLVPGPTQTAMLDAFWGDEAQRRRVEDMILLGRPGQAQEIGNVIAFLLSGEASFMTGSTVVVDGGMVMQ